MARATRARTNDTSDVSTLGPPPEAIPAFCSTNSCLAVASPPCSFLPALRDQFLDQRHGARTGFGRRGWRGDARGPGQRIAPDLVLDGELRALRHQVLDHVVGPAKRGTVYRG